MAKQLQESNLIFGRVTDAQNRALANLLVYAYDRDMRSEELLGETITDRDGKYEIPWAAGQPDTKGKRTADLVIKVVTRERKTQLFASDMDNIRFNAGAREEINVVIRQAIQPEKVEYDFILGELQPLADDIPVAELREDSQHHDLSFLSKETGIPLGRIEHLAVSHKMQVEAEDIEAPFFYALLRQNTLLKTDRSQFARVRLTIRLSSDVRALLYEAALTDRETILRDVKAAAKASIVSERVAKDAKQYVTLLERYRDAATEFFQNEQPRVILERLGAFVQADKIGEMGRLFRENRHDVDMFLQKINEEGFFSSEVDAADVTLMALLGDWLGFDEKLFQSVKSKKNIEKPEDLRRLAAMNKADWKSALSDAAKAGEHSGEKPDPKLIDFHASVLVRKMEKAFPTAAFAAQLGREKRTLFQNQAEITEFFQKNEDFDLQHTNTDLFLKSKKMVSPENEALLEELKSVQRVFKLVPHYAKTNALRAQKIHSAQGIVAFGERRFVQEIAPKAGITAREAREVFHKAERVHTAAMLVVGELQDMMRAMDVAAIETSSLARTLEKVGGDFPNLKTLFKLTDACACEHCRSVYSPAAYLVEILQFLDKRADNSNNESPKDVLFKRRPDLGNIDLGCENANTPLPYIDLVCELLEAEVAPDTGIYFSGPLSDFPDPTTLQISSALLSTLQTAGLPVTTDALIFGTENPGASPTSPYYLRDKKAVCKIVEINPGDFFVYRLRQTLSTAEELAAAPEYVNAEAYKILANQDPQKPVEFAFKLPFDLAHTEAKAYFDRFGVSRADLMRDFQLSGVSPFDVEIAAERLGLTAAEHLLIFISDVAKQQKIWNTTSTNASDEMKVVDTFLIKTGLSYRELDLLLLLQFIDPTDINPANDLFIEHHYDDPNAPNPVISCDTTKKEIAHLDDAALDRMHRFLRLQKKTGWSMETLDEIISQSSLGNGQLDVSCLLHAADLLQLSEKTGIKIEELVGFYGHMPRKVLSDDLPVPLYRRVFLNKAKNGPVEEKLLPRNVDGTQLLTTVETTLAVCLQISVPDLVKLLPLLPSPFIDFPNLSYLFAATQLMKKLKLTADQFVALSLITGLGIQNSPADTLAFVRAAEAAKAWHLKPTELRFMLFHENNNPLFNPNWPVPALKTTLAGQLSKLGLAAADVATITDFVDSIWATPAAAVLFVQNKLGDLLNTNPIVEAINNLANVGNDAARTGLVKAMLDAVLLAKREIKPEKIGQILGRLQTDLQQAFEATKSPFDSNLSADDQKETFKAQLSKLVGMEKADMEILVSLVDGNWIFTWKDGTGTAVQSLNITHATAFLHFKLDSFFGVTGVTLIATTLSPLGTAAGIAASKKALHEADLQAVQSAKDAVELGIDPMAPANLAAAQASAALSLTALDTANTALEDSRKALLEAFLFQISLLDFQTAKIQALEQSMAASFKTDLEFTRIVLQYAQLIQPVPAGTELLRDLLLSVVSVDPPATYGLVLPPINENDFPKQYQSLRLLHKLLPFVGAYKLENEQVEWHFKNNSSPTLGWLEWDSIPYETGQYPASPARFMYFSEILALARQLTPVANPEDPDAPVTFLDLADMLVQGGTRADWISTFSLLTGYDKNEVDAVDTYLFPFFHFGTYTDPKAWKSILICLEHLRKLGSTVAQVTTFIQPVLTNSEVQTLRTALQYRYDEDTWRSTLEEITDAIRPQKRNALVAYLLATNPDMKNENDLYDYFLVDVEMEACMPSSRIVQAHGAVQLFVQRCLLGLEPEALAKKDDDPAWEQWKWMKNYRVWEANRKIFLYPENWIEADLRDDKSFLFAELENELQQNELTDFTAEEALIKYLEKLDNIAFLEVMATWYQSDIRTMHVFARTKGGDPSIYYYRRFEQERYWTAWEKVELDITGDHLLAFERNNRLTLAWPVFTEEADPGQKAKIPSESDQGKEVDTEKPRRRLKIQLAMSEFANKIWQPKKISKDGILTPANFTKEAELLRRDKFNLMYLEAAEQVWVFKTNFNFVVKGTDWDQQESHTSCGAFNLTGCKGYPELAIKDGFVASDFNADLNINITNIGDFLPDFKNAHLRSQRYHEYKTISPDDLVVKNGLFFNEYKELLKKTPGTFRLTYPHQFTTFDWFSYLYQYVAYNASNGKVNPNGYGRYIKMPLGTMLPYFMEDSNHAYVIIPGFYGWEKYDSGEPNVTRIREVKRSASNMVPLIEDAIALYTKFIGYYKKDVKKFVKDPDYLAFTQKASEYDLLTYGEQFKNMYHPLVCSLRKTLYRDGIPGLMRRDTQMQQTPFDFTVHFQPTQNVPAPYPVEEVDFSSDGSYSLYNWELFFHAPLLIATQLSKNQRFEEAMSWFHYIFNPTGALSGPAPQKYWVTKPFFEYENADYKSQRIYDLLYSLSDPTTSPQIKADLEFAIDQWRIKPFRPHVIARFRPVAYQKAVLMKYLDNLIAWGDYLFRQDTMESVVQATQMYILADKLLGEKPRTIPPLIKAPYETYNQIVDKLDKFGNALIDLENILPDLGALPEGGAELPAPPVTLSMLYFCVPQNDKMLEYWGTVADRLFKIRHCQDINGVERSLALFAPPIDPAALVRAAAAGLSVSDVLAGLNAPLPYYRFNVLSQKATELANEVRSLGSSLLQTLEKKDAEAMSLLRSELEIKVLNAVRDMKKLQISEAKEQIEVLKRTKKVTEERQSYYASIEKINSKEQLNLDKLGKAQDYQMASQVVRIVAGALSMIPDVKIGVSGFGGSPEAGFTMGGTNFSRATNIAADVLSFLGSIASYEASRASTLGGYDRRSDDWKLQERLAKKELASIDKQIVAAEIRKEISENDLKNHDLQIENAKKTDDFMRTKYTNKELYQWMLGQISGVYFRAYQLAHEFAKKAERSYKFELGNDDTFISYGYWDSLKKGLQSADNLLHDIKRMETGYLNKNFREYEITKHISLALLDPLALAQLRATGVCDFEVPEALFNLDHAGHYFRRIKSVSISLPCIAGPYTSVSAKLSLVKNKYRKNAVPANLANGEYAEDPGNDERFVYNIGAIQSIATSNAQNDSGVFELNFRDERYLPFEGTGAASAWRLELPGKEFSQFNYDTIADAIVHLKYTAREGGSLLRDAAEKELKDQLNIIRQGLGDEGLHIALNMKHDMPNEWHLLKQNKTVDLKIEMARLPYFTQLLSPTLKSVRLLASLNADDGFSCNITGETTALGFSKISDWGIWQASTGDNVVHWDTTFTLSADATNLGKLDNLMLVAKYVF